MDEAPKLNQCLKKGGLSLLFFYLMILCQLSLINKERNMTEMEILNQFNTFMISNSIYLAAGFFILWVAFRMVVNIQGDPGAPMLNKVLATLFGLGSVYFLLQINGFLYSNWQGTVNQLAELDNLTNEAQQFVDFVGVGDSSFSLIPADPIFAIWYLVILGIILGGIWMKRS